MMHNNAHIAAVDVNRHNDVVFQKTVMVTDWYHDGGDGHPLGTVQTIGKVQGLMMGLGDAGAAARARRHREALGGVGRHGRGPARPREPGHARPDGSDPDGAGRDEHPPHARLLARTKRLMREAGYDVVFTQPFDISMNSHMCGTVVAGADPGTSVLDGHCKAHDLDNLWVVDAGFFPSSAAMNPALTIAAQALRVVAESDLAG